VDLGVRGTGYLVVGGTAGMGLATARVLAADGAELALVGRDEVRAKEAAAQLAEEHDVNVVPIVADMTRPGAELEVIAQARAGLADLAGIAVFTGLAGHQAADAPDEVWDDAFQDVLMGTVRAVRATVPALVERGGGTILTTAAYSIHSPHAGRSAYGVLKGGIAVFTKGLAKAYGAQGIRANCIAPGVIETAALTEIRAAAAKAKDLPYDSALETLMATEWGMKVALGRPGRPEEVGDLAAFLLSPRAGYLTGALVNIDGGTDF
jgi:NAD(P)-dependent dehydrogenase (short-subunit alcohol dehydrogenase family)